MQDEAVGTVTFTARTSSEIVGLIKSLRIASFVVFEEESDAGKDLVLKGYGYGGEALNFSLHGFYHGPMYASYEVPCEVGLEIYNDHEFFTQNLSVEKRSEESDEAYEFHEFQNKLTPQEIDSIGYLFSKSGIQVDFPVLDSIHRKIDDGGGSYVYQVVLAPSAHSCRCGSPRYSFYLLPDYSSKLAILVEDVGVPDERSGRLRASLHYIP